MLVGAFLSKKLKITSSKIKSEDYTVLNMWNKKKEVWCKAWKRKFRVSKGNSRVKERHRVHEIYLGFIFVVVEVPL